MTWLVYAAGTALALATADFCVKQAAGNLSNSLGMLIYGSCTFLVGLSWVAWQRFQKAPLFAQPAGIVAAIGVGIAFSLVTIGLYVTFSKGAPISSASPMIRVGGLTLASLAGLILLREPLTVRFAVGFLLAGAGVYLMIFR